MPTQPAGAPPRRGRPLHRLIRWMRQWWQVPTLALLLLSLLASPYLPDQQAYRAGAIATLRAEADKLPTIAAEREVARHENPPSYPTSPAIFISIDYHRQPISCDDVQAQYRQATRDAGWKPMVSPPKFAFEREYYQVVGEYRLELYVECDNEAQGSVAPLDGAFDDVQIEVPQLYTSVYIGPWLSQLGK